MLLPVWPPFVKAVLDAEVGWAYIWGTVLAFCDV